MLTDDADDDGVNDVPVAVAGVAEAAEVEGDGAVFGFGLISSPYSTCSSIRVGEKVRETLTRCCL